MSFHARFGLRFLIKWLRGVRCGIYLFIYIMLMMMIFVASQKTSLIPHSEFTCESLGQWCPTHRGGRGVRLEPTRSGGRGVLRGLVLCILFSYFELWWYLGWCFGARGYITILLLICWGRLSQWCLGNASIMSCCELIEYSTWEFGLWPRL